jgi:hypothetical protein
MKLGIISVDFDVINQLLIGHSILVRFWRKNGRTMGQYISYLQTSRRTDSEKREVLHKILSEFSIPMEVVRLIIKM